MSDLYLLRLGITHSVASHQDPLLLSFLVLVSTSDGFCHQILSAGALVSSFHPLHVLYPDRSLTFPLYLNTLV